jgi:hypothetical protein
MLYSASVFLMVMAQSHGFAMPKAPQRLANLQMSDQWAPNTKTINTVSLETLKWVFIKITVLCLPSKYIILPLVCGFNLSMMLKH